MISGRYPIRILNRAVRINKNVSSDQLNNTYSILDTFRIPTGIAPLLCEARKPRSSKTIIDYPNGHRRHKSRPRQDRSVGSAFPTFSQMDRSGDRGWIPQELGRPDRPLHCPAILRKFSSHSICPENIRRCRRTYGGSWVFYSLGRCPIGRRPTFCSARGQVRKETAANYILRWSGRHKRHALRLLLPIEERYPCYAGLDTARHRVPLHRQLHHRSGHCPLRHHFWDIPGRGQVLCY